MSVLHDAVSKFRFIPAYPAGKLTADGNGVAIDTQDSVGVGVVATVGVSGDTLSPTVKAELELEHSDDGVTFTDCTDDDISAPVAGTNPGTFALVDDPAEDDRIYKVNYIGPKRYIRVVANLTGTHTNGFPFSAAAVLLPQKLPG
jgi:hypothetical protein